MKEFNVYVESVVYAKSVVTTLKLNCVKTELDVTEIKLPRPLNYKLSKSWFAQKIAKELGESNCTGVPTRTCQISATFPLPGEACLGDHSHVND